MKDARVSIPGFTLTLLRLSLGVVFFWFGFLKLLEQSPVEPLIMQSYTFFPSEIVILIGIIEVLIGVGYLVGKALKVFIVMMWFQMIGVFFASFLNPQLFFPQSLLIPNLEGEFLIKNIVLLTGSLVLFFAKPTPQP